MARYVPALLLGMGLAASTLSAQAPVSLTPGSFNFDCVAENAPPMSYTSGCMPGGDVIYASGYPGAPSTTGMPASNMVTVSSITYQLQPYNQNNALQLESSTGSTGTMTLETPVSATELHFLATSVFGDTRVNIVVTFSDNSAEQIATDFSIKDWFNNTSVAYVLNGRVTCDGMVYNVDSGNPRLYTYSFNIAPANQSKQITAVTITRTGGPSTSKPYFFALSSTSASSSPGAALNFDGVNDYVNAGNAMATNFGTSDFTMELWFKANSLTSFPILFAKDQSFVFSPAFRVEIGSNAQNIGFFFNSSSGTLANFTPDNTISANAWTHYAIVRTGNTFRSYINGTLQTTSTASGNPTLTGNNFNFLLGARLSNTNGFVNLFNGVLDEFRCWNRALTQSEIQAKMNCELAGTEAGLMAYYDFNQGVAGGNNATETTLLDRSSNGNNGALTNFALNGSSSNWVAPGGVVTGNDCINCPTLSAAPGNVQISNSTCTAQCQPTGGSIAAPATGCPIGSTLQYSVNGGGWSNTLPVYNQNAAQTIQTRCLCNEDGSTTSPVSSGMTTAPANCADVLPPTLSCTNISLTFNGQQSIALHPAALASATDNCSTPGITLSPTSISAEQVGQTVPVTVTATDGSGNPATCTAYVTVGGLPAGWSQNPNGVNCSDGNNIAYNPATGVWTATSTNCYYASPFTADETAFAQRTLCGDGSITAQVTDISGTALGWAGVVMRESNAAGAKKAQLMTNLSNFSRREFRTTTNGAASPQQFPSQDRYWLRLVRAGNQFSMYVSPNGLAWYFVGAQNIPMNSCIQVGLVVTNYQQTSTVTAAFANVSSTGSNVPLLGAGEVANYELRAASFEVYPNPTSGELNLNLTPYAGKSVRIELYSLEGKLMKVVEIDEVQTIVGQLDLSSIQRGMYLIQVKSEGLPDATRKVVVNH
jgi:regulation of enolase protein 1 (concanavalin A-like superfamily)